MMNGNSERPSMTSMSPAEEFLHSIIFEGEKNGVLNPDAFLKYISPQEIMLALSDKPLARADLIDGCGLHDKIAEDLSASAAGEILESGIRHGAISSKDLAINLRSHRCTRYLDKTKVWRYIANEWQWDFRKIRGDEKRAKQFAMYFMYVLTAAIERGLLTGSDIVRGIGEERIIHHMYSASRAALFAAMLEHGCRGIPFSAERLFEYLTLKIIISRIPLAILWEKVVLARIAYPNGFAVPDAPEETIACP